MMLYVVFTGCAPLSEPPPLLSSSPQTEGRAAFFTAFRDADYEAVEHSIELLTREYLDGDDISTATLGFAHAWRLAESGRMEDGSARVIESSDLAVRYFMEASESFPKDPRLKGFLGSFKQAQGSIHGRPELQTQGWFDQGSAVQDWPEWGLFTRAYGLVTKEPEDGRFKDGVSFLWRNLDECIDGKIDRTAFDYLIHFEAVQQDDDLRNQRACGNTDVAPYNAQGFFAVFGDMLAKSGDLDMASVMYTTAADLPGSDSWPYAQLVQQRLNDLAQLPEFFSSTPERGTLADATRSTIFSGPYNCAICHAHHDSSVEPSAGE